MAAIFQFLIGCFGAGTVGYTVTFDGNGSDGGDTEAQTDSTPTALTANGFSLSGYAFTGWNTETDGSGTAYTDGATYSFAASVTLYAQWAQLFTVTFDGNGSGGGATPPQSTYGSAALTPNAFERTYYVFTGWNTAADGSGTEYADEVVFNFVADVTLYAQWLAVFTVTFNGNGADTGAVGPQIAGVPTALILNTFVLSGRAFDGWNTEADGSGVAYVDEEEYAFDADILLYAQWVGGTVTFDGNGADSGSMSPQFALEPTALTSSGFALTDYAFAGWNTEANGTGTPYTESEVYAFDANMTIYAQWALAYTITFDGNGSDGGSMDPQIAYESGQINTNVFTRTGYDFTGWNTASDGSGTAYAGGDSYPFDADVTLYAQWTEIIAYTVSFDGNGADGGSTAAQTASEASALTTNGFTLTGYYFTGWNTDSTGAGTAYADGETYAFDGDVTLYAIWALFPVLTFDGNGSDGGSMSPQSGIGLTALTTNAFTLTDWTFVGWNTASDGSGTAYADGADYDFTADAMLYAMWMQFKTVTFDGNGADGGSMNPQVSQYQVTAALNSNAFTKDGYYFLEWNESPDGPGSFYVDGANYGFENDLTLYARWGN